MSRGYYLRKVITFYNYFKLEKPGKYNIAVCMGTACYLKGASQILTLERPAEY